MLCSATVHTEDQGYQFAVDLLPVVGIDCDPVESGVPDPLSRKLPEQHLAHLAAAA
jgi:hypothetical protein